jgi:hypothetical protein
MLKIHLPERELYSEEDGEFITEEAVILSLEHSLVSLSKWESIHEKPFLSKNEKTFEEVISYVYCMIFSPEVSETIVQRFAPEDYAKINDYIDSKMTATWFSNAEKSTSREVITSELIYYWMISFNIPMECQNWHLNRLLTLIKVCSLKNQPAKKMAKGDIARRNRELNARRRMEFGTSG